MDKYAVVRLSDHAVVKIKWDEETHTGEISVTDEVTNTVYEFTQQEEEVLP